MIAFLKDDNFLVRDGLANEDFGRVITATFDRTEPIGAGESGMKKAKRANDQKDGVEGTHD